MHGIDRHRRDVVRTGLLLLFGLLFHTFLLRCIADSASTAGADSGLIRAVAIVTACLAVACTLTVVLAARNRRTAAMLLGSAATVIPVPILLLALPEHPGYGLAGLAVCAVQAQLLLACFGPAHWTVLRQLRENGRSSADLPLYGHRDFDLVLLSCAGSCVVALIVSGHARDQMSWGLAAGWACVLLSVAVSLPIEFRCQRPALNRIPSVEHWLLFAAAACALLPGRLRWALPLLALRQVVVGVRLWHRRRGGQQLWQNLIERPAQLVVVSFALAIGLGTVLLGLPGAIEPGRTLSVLDTWFTATSATCVTGLVVVDTGSTFSTFGESVILLLIQAGGLGIMTSSTFIAILFGLRVGLRGEFAIGEMIGEQRNRAAMRLLRFIVLVTLVVECVGALLLACAFHSVRLPWRQSLWYGLFHSVSAFCNAGFSLFSDSFERLATLPAFPLLLSALFVLGGLGFGVLLFLLNLLRGRRERSPYVAIVLLTSAALCLGGTALIWLLERDGAMAHMSVSDSLVNAWFHAVTPRTAGFNTVAMQDCSPATSHLTMALMFIGAAPGSTGGGIKVTTLAVLLLLIRAVLLGRNDVTAHGRRLSESTVLNAAALACLAGMVVATAAILLLATQPLPPGDVLFETVSAFGTVGLSRGITAALTPLGKVVVIVLMFVGRVGPLTLLVMMRPRRRGEVEYPSAEVMVG